MIFALKSISFLGRRCSILCQNENGPCPLLAISNVLILQNLISFHPDLKYITFDELLSRVADALVRVSERQQQIASNSSTFRIMEDDQRQHQLNSVLNILPKLVNGLDMNVRFSGATDFEFTEEISVFDALDIPLVHGWVLDPQDRATAAVIGPHVTYNHLMFKLVEYRSVVERQRQQQQRQQQQQQITQANMQTVSSSAGPMGNNIVVETTGATTTDELEGKPAALLSADYLAAVQVQLDLQETQKTPKAGTDDDQQQQQQQEQQEQQEVEQVQEQQQKQHEQERHNEQQEEELLRRNDLTPEQTALLREGPLIESFLADTASQFTYIGLLSLHQTLNERQLAVFFRNNHFSTIFRKNNSLFNLVTDQGYLDEPTVVWEQLDEIDGDTEYVDSFFARLAPLPATSTSTPAVVAATAVIGTIAAPPLATATAAPFPSSSSPSRSSAVSSTAATAVVVPYSFASSDLQLLPTDHISSSSSSASATASAAAGASIPMATAIDIAAHGGGSGYNHVKEQEHRMQGNTTTTSSASGSSSCSSPGRTGCGGGSCGGQQFFIVPDPEADRLLAIRLQEEEERREQEDRDLRMALALQQQEESSRNSGATGRGGGGGGGYVPVRGGPAMPVPRATAAYNDQRYNIPEAIGDDEAVRKQQRMFDQLAAARRPGNSPVRRQTAAAAAVAPSPSPSSSSSSGCVIC